MSASDSRLVEVSRESWLPAPDYEGRYEVSSLGRVRSLPRVEASTKGVRAVKGCILKPVPNVDGYLVVSLRIGGRLRVMRVHRLVCRAFHGEQPNALHNEVGHLDGDRANARADNLKWVGKVENHFHRRAHGTHPAGEKHPRAKLTEVQALDILSRARRGNFSALASQYGVSPSTIGEIARGRRWKHLRKAVP